MKRFFLNTQAFTLIELLVTIAIVSVIATIAISQFSMHKAKAYDLAALQQLRDMQVAIEASMQDVSANCSQQVLPGSDPVVPSTCINLSGFKHEKGVYITVGVDPRYYNIVTSHCNGTLAIDSSGGVSATDTGYRSSFATHKIWVTGLGAGYELINIGLYMTVVCS